ncbi:hypothetical protein [uncultured Pseudomonas sp.]|uniref:hypothetical protein n=1 Tax=uncultured Pseudomonas sp. TaxID=114707 RepID=UPI0025ED175C|nr:hypothetical protein [uncultured Pseudomonas sp.]
MAAKKFLRNVNGYPTEVAGVQASTGTANAGDIIALDDTGKLPASMLPTGIGADTASMTASEALAAGAWVNIWSNGGAFAVRNADASGGVAKQAHGFVLTAVASGGTATVYFEGSNNQVSGMTPGDVWLSATPGVATATVPTTAAYIAQKLGVATAATVVNSEIDSPIVLA